MLKLRKVYVASPWILPIPLFELQSRRVNKPFIFHIISLHVHVLLFLHVLCKWNVM
jgi:hypothetical protein